MAYDEPSATAKDASSVTSITAWYLILPLIASRLLTFLGNQFLLRYVSPSLFGLAVQLELLVVTILVSSRESLRVALQRQPVLQASSLKHTDGGPSRPTSQIMMQQAINMSYLVLPIGGFASGFFIYGYIRKSNEEVLNSTDFGTALAFYALATALELFAEPLFIVVQQRALYKARASAQTAAAVSTCIAGCLAAVVMSSSYAKVSVLPFGIGQAMGGLVLLYMYLRAAKPQAKEIGFSLLPQQIQDQHSAAHLPVYWLGYFHKPLLNLTMTFYAQSVFKLFLTEGDKLVLSFIADLSAQGAFALASNYGGLFSRLIFQPIEETSRNVFGRLLAPVMDSPGSINTASEVENVDVIKSKTAHVNNGSLSTTSNSSDAAGKVNTSKNLHSTNVKLALDHLSTILHLYSIFSLAIIAVFPYIFPVVVSTLIGQRWSSASITGLLSAYAYYLPFLAMNGVLDAFVTSVATPRELSIQSIVMMIITVLYGSLAWFFMAGARNMDAFAAFDLGPAGLVWANVANMTLRIIYAVWYIQMWLRRNVSEVERRMVLKKSLPSAGCTITALAVALWLRSSVGPILNLSSKKFFGIKGIDANDAGSLVVGALLVGTSILFLEHEFLISMLPTNLTAKLKPYLPNKSI